MTRALACLLFCAATAAGQGDLARPLPLNDLGPGRYAGEQGGLYPAGLNMLPGSFRAAALERSARVVPLDRQGRFAPEWGRIGLLLLGTANTRVVAESLLRAAAADGERSAAVVPVNGAAGGSIRQMAGGDDRTWIALPKLLAQAGLTPAQVQVAWLDATSELVAQPFPDNARRLQEDLAAIVAIAKQQLPNLRVVFLSSGAYGGYAGARGARDSYESAFAVKWLIEEQIDATGGVVPAPLPWMAWGPYLWADGGAPRSDGLAWGPGDFVDGGRRLAAAGAERVAGRLLHFLHVDAQARSWYLAQPEPACRRPALASTFGHGRVGECAPSIAASALPTLPLPEPLRVAVTGAPAKSRGLFLVALDPGHGSLRAEGPLLLSPQRAQALPVLTDASGRATLSLGRVLFPREKFCGKTLCVQFLSEADGQPVVSPGLRLQTGH